MNYKKLILTIIATSCILIVLQYSYSASEVDQIINTDSKKTNNNLIISPNNPIKENTPIKLINVPYKNQNDIVYGCEAVSSTMLLNYFGYNIDEKEFTNKYLIKRDWHFGEQNVIYGPDPNAAYPGNPYIQRGLNCGFGCYAPSTAKSIKRVLNKNHYAKVTTGLSIEDLITNYVSKNIPVLIWATMDMKASRLTTSWIIDYVDENSPYKIGDTFRWIAGEHCLVLVGYNDNGYYFNDPYKNHGLIFYEKSLVNHRFIELSKQSVVILENSDL